MLEKLTLFWAYLSPKFFPAARRLERIQDPRLGVTIRISPGRVLDAENLLESAGSWDASFGPATSEHPSWDPGRRETSEGLESVAGEDFGSATISCFHPGTIQGNDDWQRRETSDEYSSPMDIARGRKKMIVAILMFFAGVIVAYFLSLIDWDGLW